MKQIRRTWAREHTVPVQELSWDENILYLRKGDKKVPVAEFKPN
jgi:hypothetical protein